MEGEEIQNLKVNAINLANIVGRQPMAMKILMSHINDYILGNGSAEDDMIFEENIVKIMRELKCNKDVVKWVIEFNDINDYVSTVK